MYHFKFFYIISTDIIIITLVPYKSQWLEVGDFTIPSFDRWKNQDPEVMSDLLPKSS